jgi:hypothetical protein
MWVTNIAAFTNIVGLFIIRYPYPTHNTQATEFTTLNLNIDLNVIDNNTTAVATHPNISTIIISFKVLNEPSFVFL